MYTEHQGVRISPQDWRFALAPSALVSAHEERRTASNSKSVPLRSSHEPPHPRVINWQRKNADPHRLHSGYRCYHHSHRGRNAPLSEHPEKGEHHMSTEDNKSTVRRAIETLNQGNVAAMSELWTPDLVNYDPNNPQVRKEVRSDG